jgi:hypothetical protein
VVIVAGAMVLWPWEDRVTRANYDRFQIGMTREEVEAILGLPGDYSTGPSLFRTLTFDRGEPSSEGGAPTYWGGDTGAIGIMFDRKGSVAQTGFAAVAPIPLGPLDTLLWHAQCQWHRWFP